MHDDMEWSVTTYMYVCFCSLHVHVQCLLVQRQWQQMSRYVSAKTEAICMWVRYHRVISQCMLGLTFTVL